MKSLVVVLITALTLFLLTSALIPLSKRKASAFSTSAQSVNRRDSDESTFEDNAANRRLNACTPPDKLIGSIEETAWRLWIASTCPVNDHVYPYVVWENWIEQTQMYPSDPANVLQIPAALAPSSSAKHLLHASPLALARHPGIETTVAGLLGAPDQNCNKAQAPPDSQKALVICEEVRLNGATQDFITSTAMWNRNGQKELAVHHGNIQFPRPSIEVKANWIKLSSIGFDCTNLPTDFDRRMHVETINGNCYAMVGIHVISKLLDHWIFATFEPQNLTTNPFRCKVLGCSDSFGSLPVRTRGAFTGLTPQVERLMSNARLAPEWENYRLDGVQIEFVREDGKPILLGNSIIEGENVGMDLRVSSCISCHALSSVKNDGSDGIAFLDATNNPIGEPEPLPSHDWIRRDFVWSLLEACPSGPNAQSCTP